MQLEWRMTLDLRKTPHRPPATMYFPIDLFQLNQDEVFVDAGAYDGDSIRDFLKATDGESSLIIGLEPDPMTYARLEDYASGLAGTRTRLHRMAVADYIGEMRFSATGTMMSVPSDDGNDVIDCTTIDAIVNGDAPTFIKMDIEGCEGRALQGAARTIVNCRPILAICAYHKYEDLWEIPIAIHSIVPDYSIHLHSYSDGWWELICYGVPEERQAMGIIKYALSKDVL